MSATDEPETIDVEVLVEGQWIPGRLRQVQDLPPLGDVELEVTWQDGDGPRTGRFPAGQVRLPVDGSET